MSTAPSYMSCAALNIVLARVNRVPNHASHEVELPCSARRDLREIVFKVRSLAAQCTFYWSSRVWQHWTGKGKVLFEALLSLATTLDPVWA